MPTFRQDTKIGGMVPMMKTDDYNDQSVTKDKLRDGNVTTEKLADGAVNTDKLSDGVITTPKIANTPSFQSPNTSKSNEVLSPSNQVSFLLTLSEP